MKHWTNIVLLLIFGWSSVFAQDAAVLAQRDLVGTARYVSLGGAMTAIGGDPSAVMANPAGLGVYRRLEVSLTLDESVVDFRQREIAKANERVNAFTASQASFVYSFGDPAKSRGLLYNNFMISYHRLATFNRTYAAGYSDDIASLSDVAALKTNGLTAEVVGAEGRWQNEEIGWLSCQAYDTYLINPDPAEPNKWYSLLEQGQTLHTHLRMQETGYVNQYSLSWGGNISNKIFLGASLNMVSLYHNQTASYFELFGDDCTLDNNTYVSHSGVGVNASFGIIGHPLRWLRLGASFTTPTALSVTTTNYGTLKSQLWYVDSIGNPLQLAISSETPINRIVDKSLTMPLRVSGGLAFQLKNYGLLSLQYDYAHRKGISDTHTLRAGIEGVIVNRFFLTAGYAFESTFGKSSAEMLAYNTVRTDAYSQYLQWTHNASAGFGWHGDHVSVTVAYKWRLQQFDVYAHEWATPYDLRATSHSIAVTVNFHTRAD